MYNKYTIYRNYHILRDLYATAYKIIIVYNNLVLNNTIASEKLDAQKLIMINRD